MLAAQRTDRANGKIFLVTDAMPPVGADIDTYTLGGVTVTCRNGRCETPDGVLAGSMLDMGSTVRNSVDSLGLPLAEAVRMAATYPADFLGLGSTHGRVAPGCRADFVVMDEALRVQPLIV